MYNFVKQEKGNNVDYFKNRDGGRDWWKIAFWVVFVVFIGTLALSNAALDKVSQNLDEMDRQIQQLEAEKVQGVQSFSNSTPTPIPVIQSEVVVDKPKANALLSGNKVEIVGRAKGSWFFEANMVCKLMDGNTRQIGKIGCHATENWMQEGYVDFEGTIWIRGLPSTTPIFKTGWLIIENDNPSGDPKNLKQFKVPVKFK